MKNKGKEINLLKKALEEQGENLENLNKSMDKLWLVTSVKGEEPQFSSEELVLIRRILSVKFRETDVSHKYFERLNSLIKKCRTPLTRQSQFTENNFNS